MHAICQASYGEMSRMCTTEEYWKTPSRTTIEEGYAWIQPVIVSVFTRASADQIVITHVDWTGTLISAGVVGEYRTIDCVGWTNDISQGEHAVGTIVSGETGRIMGAPEGFCSRSNKVACCVPASQ